MSDSKTEKDAMPDVPGSLFDWADSYARLSGCEQYRYTLGRVWEPSRPLLTFVMLNPSIADATDDDPTIVKCKGFATRLGFGGIHVVNLFAFRATKPSAMWAARKAGVDIIGPDNDEVLREAFSRGDAIAAWGANGAADPLRVQFVTTLARAAGSRLQALSVTQAGDPGHPLMLPYSSTLRTWPDPLPCGHHEVTTGCGGCDPGAIEFVITDEGERRPFDAVRDMRPTPDYPPVSAHDLEARFCSERPEGEWTTGRRCPVCQPVTSPEKPGSNTGLEHRASSPTPPGQAQQ